MAKIRLALAPPHTRIHADLCGRCPQGSTGCCAAPPVFAWADLGRIVVLGGREWLLDEIAAGRLYPCARGLAITRVDNPDAAESGRAKKCGYHGSSGCTIGEDRRSATCNYFVCDDAFDDAHAEELGTTRRARKVHARLTEDYGRWDLEIAARLGGTPPRWDRALFDRLGALFVEIALRQGEPGLDALGASEKN
jgi:hypothetical protein